MPTSKRVLLVGCTVLLGACGSPLSSQTPSTGGHGGGPGSTGATGGTGGGNTATIAAATGGAGGTTSQFTPSRDPTFDPSVLILPTADSVDGGAVATDGVHSAGIVIFDRSGSMADGWTTTTTDEPDAGVTTTKWVAASRALIGALTPPQDRVTIGAVLFPSDDSCGVAPFGHPVQFSFQPGRQFLAQYIERSPENQSHGATPLATAFQVADQAITLARSQGLLERPFYVMLLTDGEPNCNSDMSIVLTLASSWLAQGIRTHVFGLPGSEDARAVLDSISRAGGTETVLVPGSRQGLQDLQGGIAAVIP